MRNRKMKTRICADCGEGATVMVHSKGVRCNSCAKKRDHDKGVEFSYKHGLSGSPTYVTWASMIDRCKNSNSAQYKNYGERGILVCYEWLTFEGFLKDMGERKTTDHLHRLDNDKDYGPANCIWLDRMLHLHYHAVKKRRLNL